MKQMGLREYIDSLDREGYTVRDDHGDDPFLIRPDGSAVDTWRENYPYDERMSRSEYEEQKRLLQIELLKRHRAGDADPGVVQGIHLSINGIAAGLRNSG